MKKKKTNILEFKSQHLVIKSNKYICFNGRENQMHLLAQNFNFQYFEFIIFHGLGLNEIISNSKI